MKKSELKALLKIITEEVVAAKKACINESEKGLSGFKKSKESTEHTEKVANSKDLTGGEPKEKEEGKKLPVVKKPANPQKVGSIKEDIMAMIREAIEEADIDEIRTKGSVGSKFKVADASSPTGWVVKGHKTIPDGTPTEAPRGDYQRTTTNPNMGRPKKTGYVSKGTIDADTKNAIDNILMTSPTASDEEILSQLNARVEDEEKLNVDPSFVKSVAAASRKERSAEIQAAPEDAPESDLASMTSAEERKKAAQRAYWIKKLQSKRGIK